MTIYRVNWEKKIKKDKKRQPSQTHFEAANNESNCLIYLSNNCLQFKSWITLTLCLKTHIEIYITN